MGVRLVSLITYLTRIHFADRALEDALPSEMTRHQISRPLLIASESTTQSDALDRLLDTIPATIAPATFVLPDTSETTADRARVIALLAEAESDGIVAFGGLRALDLARTVSRRQVPVITIPTRTNSVGLGPLGQSVKGVPSLRADLPVAVLCDATLTLDAGPLTTAAAGMDALVHCLESYLSTTFNPPADGIALDGLRRAVVNLEQAVQDGTDIAARREMLIAALDAGLAGEKGFGGIEAAAHGLESVFDARHGVLHSALVSEFLAFNAPAVSDRFTVLREVLGLPEGADLADALSRLGHRVGLPLRLSEIGVDAALVPTAARTAAADPSSRTNPRHVTERDYERIMRAAL